MVFPGYQTIFEPPAAGAHDRQSLP